jgi:hypothetical protein
LVLDDRELLEKQSESSDDEAEAHERETGTDPGEQRALGSR